MIKRKNKRWQIMENEDTKIDSFLLSSQIGSSRALSTLLVNRGFKTPDDAIGFMNKSQETLHNPFLLNDMDKAVERITTAIENKEKITIYGDYDVDGVTSVSILYLYLTSIGGVVEYYIPSRKSEGYGMSIEAISRLQSNGTKLIITVDTGITAIEEIEYANELGLEVVVTDHHECTEVLPNAVAVINPKRRDSTYPFAHLAGVGVVFKLLCALQLHISKDSIKNATRTIAQKYSDLTAIGTIADVMPIIDENRIIVAYGLQKAEKTDKIGLEMLINICRNGEGKSIYNKNKAKKALTSTFVGFTLAPRINAAGRISSASIAVELFLSKTEAQAESYAYQLCEINKERQYAENKIAEQANKIVEENGLDKKPIIILDNEEWNHGIVGIVSSKVTDKFGVPSVLISFEGNEDPFSEEAIGKGSGRSINGMNLVEALTYCSPLLEKFGGHELAAGLTVKRNNLEALKEKLEEYASKCFKNVDMTPVLEIDTELDTSEINMEIAKEISVLEPFGVANPTPIFAARNMVIEDIIPVGMNKHLRIILSKDGEEFSAMLFAVSPEEFDLEPLDEVDVAFNLETNEFAGNVTLSLKIKDIKLSDTYLQIEKQNEDIYQQVKDGTSTLSAELFIPERDDFSAVYKHLLNASRCNKDTFSYMRLTKELNRYRITNHFTYSKVKIIIKVFTELNIVAIEEIDDFSFTFKIAYSKNKTNLEKSSLLKKLKSMYPVKK